MQEGGPDGCIFSVMRERKDLDAGDIHRPVSTDSSQDRIFV